MATFKNLEEFYAIIGNPTNKAIDYVVDKILTELNLQMVNKKIGLNENAFYSPTGEFYNAWRADITTRVGQYFKTSVSFHGDELSVDPDNFVHGSNFYGIDDVRDIMPYIIFGGNSGDLFGKGFWTKRRDAWSPTISRLNRSFSRWIVEGFSSAGFQVKSGNVFSITET